MQTCFVGASSKNKCSFQAPSMHSKEWLQSVGCNSALIWFSWFNSSLAASSITGDTTSMVDSWLLGRLQWPALLWLVRTDTAAVLKGEAVSIAEFLIAYVFELCVAEVTKKHRRFEIWGHSLLISVAAIASFQNRTQASWLESVKCYQLSYRGSG